MVTTTYQCDRCGAKQSVSDQMWFVGTICYHFRSSYGTYPPRATALWCRKCADELNLVTARPEPKAGVVAEPEMTIEDKLREIIRTLVAEVA
jgi:ribosomal protein L40E